MKISIITPTHDTSFLKELEATILAQTYTNWEWIILLNNGADYLAEDPRIKIFTCPFRSNSIGLLKRYACMQAAGEIIAEVDHDDMITPDCLEILAEAFLDTGVGFVYSDNATLDDNFKPYGKEYGWSYRMFNWNGKDLYAMYTQPLYPGRFGYIWFAPDHIRAWRKDVYENIGGHTDTKDLCDDQDLIHRFYMVTKFKYIPKVLYIYRITGKNSWLQQNEAIQKHTVAVYDKNILNLACRFSEINNLLKVDLCGAFNKPEGFISIDIYDADIITDLEKGIPLKDNSVGVIRAVDALEHIKNQRFLMEEIHRVLAPGGILLSETPSTDGRGAFQDPTHVSFWNQNSFWYWTRKDTARYIRNTKMFRECKLTTGFPNEHCKANNIPYVVAHLEKLESKLEIKYKKQTKRR